MPDEKIIKETASNEEALENISTSFLMNELQRREGVESVTAEPYEKKAVFVEGPAVVLIVMD